MMEGALRDIETWQAMGDGGNVTADTLECQLSVAVSWGLLHLGKPSPKKPKAVPYVFICSASVYLTPATHTLPSPGEATENTSFKSVKGFGQSVERKRMVCSGKNPLKYVWRMSKHWKWGICESVYWLQLTYSWGRQHRVLFGVRF